MSVQKLRAGDVVAKTYEVENLVGAGPLGVTYGALVIDNQKKVSLKFLPGPAAEARRLDEVMRQVQSVKSDGVVKTLRAGVWQESTYVVAEWVAYPSLRELMDRYQQEKRALPSKKPDRSSARCWTRWTASTRPVWCTCT